MLLSKSLFNIPNDKNFSYVFGGEYRISKVLVKGFSLFIVLFILFCGFQILSHERFYLVNLNPVAVVNPVFGSESDVFPDYLKGMEFLPVGFEAGYNHAWYVASAPVLSLLLLMLMFIINHFVYNNSYGKGD